MNKRGVERGRGPSGPVSAANKSGRRHAAPRGANDLPAHALRQPLTATDPGRIVAALWADTPPVGSGMWPIPSPPIETGLH